MDNLHKATFTFDDDYQEFNGYTDGSHWNGWSCPIFTAEELKKVFHPYNVRFSFTEDNIPVATVEMEDSTEVFESSPIWDEDQQEFLIGYVVEGFCFMEKE